jgi:hypothetical protein
MGHGREDPMNEWLLLVGVKGLKAAIVGSLSVLSFGVDVLTAVADRGNRDDLDVVVVACRAEPVAAPALAWVERPVARVACCESPLDRFVHGIDGAAGKPDLLVQLGTLVPPILVEALFPPDLLLPPLPAAPETPAPPQTVQLAAPPTPKRPT